jgi:hypothetical protein
MNFFIAEQIRIAMQCTQVAQQCQMMLLFPWMCLLQETDRKTHDQ